MDLITLLKDRVTPMVMKGQTTYLTEKSTALAEFYPFLLAALKSNSHLIPFFQNNLNPRLSDLFTKHPQVKDEFLQAVSQGVPAEEIEPLLNHAIPATLNVIEEEVGSRDTSVIEHFLGQHHTDISSAIAPWAKGLLATLGFGALSHATTAHAIPQQAQPTPTVVTQRPVATEENKKKSGSGLLAVIALIILALLAFLFMRSCKKEDVPTAQPTVAQSNNVTQQAALFQVATDAGGGLTNCMANIGNPSFIETLQKDVKQLFNHQTGCTVDSSQSFGAELVDQSALAGVLNLVKGTPNVHMTWTGNQLTLQGGDVTAVQALADKIKPLVKDMQIVVEKPLNEADAVNSSIDQAKQALSSINPDQAKPADIAKALNMQIINFASASKEIPDANKVILDQAAELMNKVPNVKLGIKGYTDSTGNAEKNKALSLKRAQSVADYLVSKGVDPSKLVAQGFGQENPVADNATKEGQFKNRRIEFEVVNTETGTVREVTENGVQEKK